MIAPLRVIVLSRTRAPGLRSTFSPQTVSRPRSCAIRRHVEASSVGKATGVPFSERGGRLRGMLDLATGRYPSFLFGGSTGRLLPVFHLHEVTRAVLEPRLQFLSENGYRTVTTDAIARLVRDGRHPGPFTVALCFDDARASLWTVAMPLLRKYNFRAITYAIPGRIVDADATRPTLDDGGLTPERADLSDRPFVTWPELRALQAGGWVDVQNHTYSHASVFCADRVTRFVTPEFASTHLLDRPQISQDGDPVFLQPDDLGAPLYPQRSRMSDAVRYVEDMDRRDRCLTRVREAGGAAFFAQPGWQRTLRAIADEGRGVFESDDTRTHAIRVELDRARAVLEDRLRAPVHHLCFPWGVGGRLAREAARQLGIETAFSERLFGLRAVRAGDDRYRLMRLSGKWITRLPRRRSPHVVGSGAPRNVSTTGTDEPS